MNILEELPAMWRKNKKEVLIIMGTIVAISVAVLNGPAQAIAPETTVPDERVVALEIEAMSAHHDGQSALPAADHRKLEGGQRMPVTAYNSLPAQTDSTPCIGAQGTDICELYAMGEQICAANFVPLGTKIQVDGLGVCTVRDRMNARYYYRVDWYMGMDVPAARSWGVRNRQVAVYP